MPSLAITLDGVSFPNPFLIASGPPSTNERMIARAFDEGWGGVVAKTVCLEAATIRNVAPRYARLQAPGGEVIGFENIELISDRPFETWLDEFRRLKDRYPDRILIASIMEEYACDRWQEIAGRCLETGVDGLELNLSCPHGLPERRMGSAMGQNPAMVEDVCRWVRAITSKPVWAKMTPNITSVVEPAKAAVAGGASGITAINTILSVMGVDLDTLRPMPTVEGWSEPGGYSYIAMRPIALRMVSEIARALPGVPVSGVGGVATSADAIQFMLLGAGTVQVCTAVMLQGMGIIGELCEGTLAWMQRQGFETLDDFRGHSLQYFTTHADLVARHDTVRRERRQAAAAAQMQREGLAAASLDNAWEGDRLTQQTDDLSQPVLNRS